MSIAELNLGICRALGIAEPERVYSVDLQLRHDSMPVLVVQRYAKADEAQRLVGEVLDLLRGPMATRQSQGAACG